VRHRVHHPIELFQKLHPQRIDKALEEAGFFSMNEAHHTAEVAEYFDESEGTRKARVKLSQALRMQLRSRVVNVVFADSSVEERAVIDAKIEEEKADAATAMSKGKGRKEKNRIPARDNDGERAPEEYLA
jgi:hypothetical protein